MKPVTNPLLYCILFFLNTQNIVAQLVTEKYFGGQTKLRHVLQPNNTFCMEHLFENGQYFKKVWKDSTHYFYPNHQIALKIYGQREDRKLPLWCFNAHSFPLWDDERSWMAESTDSTYSYYRNGQLQEALRWQQDTFLNYIIYDSTGGVSKSATYIKQNFHTFKYLEINGNERNISISDTLTQIREVFQYVGQQEKSYERFQWQGSISENHIPDFKGLKRVLRDKQGKIFFSWTPDSLPIHADKDNGLCLYGFRNAQEEWVIRPQFEQIENFNNSYFIVNQNGKWGLLDKYGKVVIPIEWDDLNALSEWFEDASFTPKTHPADPPSPTARLVYKKKGLEGVMDGFGNIILDAAYQQIISYKYGLYKIKIGKYYGIVNEQGKGIVPAKYAEINFTRYSDLFITSDTVEGRRIRNGLVNASGQTLLSSTKDIWAYNMPYARCFSIHSGIFHADSGWVLKPIGERRGKGREDRFIQNIPTYTILYETDSTNTERCGVLEATSPIPKMELPFDYDKITYILKKEYFFEGGFHRFNHNYDADTLFHCVKQGKHGIWDPLRHKWLLPLEYEDIYRFGDSLYFVSHHQKWQFVNRQGQRVLSETFDTAKGGLTFPNPFQQNDEKDGCFVVQKDTMWFYSETSFPARTCYKNVNPYPRAPIKVEDWYINEAGKILLSPDYKSIWEKEGYSVIRHKASGFQQFVDNQGHKHPFLLQYHIQEMDFEANWVLVQDTATKRFGLMAANQKVILNCQFFGMSEPNAEGCLWARVREPEAPSKGEPLSSHNIKGNWQLYHKSGKLLTHILFDYPFEWQHGLGIGQVQGKCGIWNAQGQNILPAQYDKIAYDTLSKVFYLFKNGKGETPFIGFANYEGQLVIDAVLLNMSQFNGNDAFIETADGYGMIQKNGSYRIPPRPYALQQAPFAIRPFWNFAPSGAYRPVFSSPYEDDKRIRAFLDTVRLDVPRFQIENFLLEQVVSRYFIESKWLYSMPPQLAYCYFSKNVSGNGYMYPLTLKYGAVMDSLFYDGEVLRLRTVARTNFSLNDVFTPYNFKLKNNIWVKTKLEEILFLNPANEQALNQLLFQKIGALKNQEMDCGNPNTYFERAKKWFYILPTGVLFWMPRYNYVRNLDAIPILLDWSVLKPFLK